jgi:tetratricopeptide (TPR) repeat protein
MLLMASTLSTMGSIFSQMNQPEKAMQAYEDALQICEEDNIPLLKGRLIGSIGLLMTEDARYVEEGLKKLDQALAMAQQIRCAPDEFTALYFLGVVRRRDGQYDIAQDYYETMLVRAQTWKSRAYEGFSFYELGRLHIYSEAYDEALANFEQALLIQRETMNPFYEAQTEAAIGTTYAMKREYDVALSHYMAARILYDALDDGRRVGEMTRTIVFTYISRFVDGVLRFLGVRGDDQPDDSEPMA